MLTFTCPICQQAFTLSCAEMPRSCTLDCPQCGGLLLYTQEQLYDFHAKLHADDPRWPVDGKGTHCLLVQPDSPSDVRVDALALDLGQSPAETIETVATEFRAGKLTLAEMVQRLARLRRRAHQEQRCASCGQAVDLTAFRDEVSRREYHISNFCQQCQDRFFGERDQ